MSYLNDLPTLAQLQTLKLQKWPWCTDEKPQIILISTNNVNKCKCLASNND
jgi:hypothetical protein